MVRLSNKHPVFNSSVLWPMFLVSTALFLPVVLAKSLPPRPQPIPSPSEPSPLSEPFPQHPLDNLSTSAEREWRQRLVKQSLAWQRSPATSTNTAQASAKTDTPQSKSSDSKTTQQQQQKAQTQASKPSQPSDQKQGKSNNSPKKRTQPAPIPEHHAPVLELRVAIANGESSLTVGTSTEGEVLDANGKTLGKLSANDGTNVESAGSNIRIGKWLTPAGVWLKPMKDGFVYVGDRWFRGDLLLVSQGDTLLAVNYVDLEDYLVSVVGAEVSPSWPMDALKAQAIAARSYALVHYFRPANPLYDLGNTQRWQVYRGIKDEWNTTRQAVQETSGVFLSYKGGVVESMYAASDEIVSNVFGGRGMSQNGALQMAQQGYNYQEILGNYYPGTGLAWIDTKQSDVD